MPDIKLIIVIIMDKNQTIALKDEGFSVRKFIVFVVTKWKQ